MNEYLNGRFVCTKESSVDYMTIGKLYKFVNGFVVFDNFETNNTAYCSLDDFHSHHQCVIEPYNLQLKNFI